MTKTQKLVAVLSIIGASLGAAVPAFAASDTDQSIGHLGDRQANSVQAIGHLGDRHAGGPRPIGHLGD